MLRGLVFSFNVGFLACIQVKRRLDLLFASSFKCDLNLDGLLQQIVKSFALSTGLLGEPGAVQGSWQHLSVASIAFWYPWALQSRSETQESLGASFTTVQLVEQSTVFEALRCRSLQDADNM